MSRGILLQDFTVGRLTFRPTQRLSYAELTKISDLISRSLAAFPDMLKCEGDAKDPRCPTSGTGDFPNIALAAFNKEGEIEGALHIGSITLLSRTSDLVTVEAHVLPAFPDLTATQEGDMMVDMAVFSIDNVLATGNGFNLKIIGFKYAIETDTRLDSRIGTIHSRFLRSDRLQVSEVSDPTRDKRQLVGVRRSVKVRRR